MKWWRVLVVAVVVVGLSAGLTFLALKIFAPPIEVSALRNAGSAETVGMQSAEPLSALETNAAADPFVPETEEPAEEPAQNAGYGDFLQATSAMQMEFIETEAYTYVKDLTIEVYDDDARITIAATLSDKTAIETAGDLADTLLRRLNALMTGEEDFSETSYGSLYDSFDVFIGVAPLSASPENTDEWWVYQLIKMGNHDKISLKIPEFEDGQQDSADL